MNPDLPNENSFQPQSQQGQYSHRISNEISQGRHKSFRISEEFFRQVIDSLEDYAVFTTDTSGNVSSWNPGAENLLGYSETEIIGQPVAVIFTEQDQQQGAPAQELSTALREGRALDERFHRRKDGTTFWASGKVFPLKDEEQNLRGFTKIMRDLSRQRRAQQDLEQVNQHLEDRVRQRTQEVEASQAQVETERNRLQTLLDQAPVAMGLFQGMDQVVVSANRLLCQLLGYPAEQMLGRPLLEAVPELQGQGFEKLIQEVLVTGVPFRGQEQPAQLLRNGRLETNYYDFVYQPLYDGQGNIIGVLDVAIEVTEQVLARQHIQQLNAELEARVTERTQALKAALLQTEQKHQQLVEQQGLLQRIIGQVPASIATLSGPEHRFSFFNSRYQQLVNDRAQLGHTVAELLPEVIEQGFIGLLDHVYATGQPFIGTETPIQLLDPATSQFRQYFLDFIYQPLEDEQHQTTGILAFVVDATEKVLARQRVEQSEQQAQALAEELAASNEELRASNEEIISTNEELAESNQQLSVLNVDLDNFVYTASHDLKAPIANIEGMLTLLFKQLPEETLASERVQRLSQMMQESVSRFKQTIQHLTEVTKLQKESNQPLIRVDLSDMVQYVLLDLAPMIEDCKAQVQVEVGDCQAIRFSEKNLRSVVYNLVSNALKYRAEERVPLVRIECREVEGYNVLSISDNGMGLDTAAQGKLFSMFKRFHNHVEGSGIGLYMIKRMVENAGGRIEVESQVGVGSTFQVYFKR